RITSLGPMTLVGGVIVVPFVLWAVALELEALEAASLLTARQRLKRQSKRDAAAELVAPWVRNFDEAGQGQGSGTGVRGRSRWMLIVGTALGAAAATTGAAAFAVWSMTEAIAKRYAVLLEDRLPSAYQYDN